MSAWKKNKPDKTQPQKTPPKPGFVFWRSQVFVSAGPCEKGAPAAAGLEVTRQQQPLSTCLDGRLEGKGICAWVSQAKTDTHSPHRGGKPALVCWAALFCAVGTFSVEAGHCALRCGAWKDQNVPCAWLQTCLLHASKTTHLFAGGRAADLLGWALMTWVLLVIAVLLGTYCGNSVR